MANVSKLSLAALRDRINAGTREVDVLHNSESDGSGTAVLSKMVYIPKFRIPANTWGTFPTQDLKLGGFLIDKYPCSQPDATAFSRGTTTANTPGKVAATSQQGVVPWTDIDWNNSKTACENRVINGRTCHLVTMKEWATMCYLIKLLGHDVRGNNYWGRDLRDADVFENYGVKDPLLHSYAAGYSKDMARVLTGTGPVSWSHNGMANGVFDLVGNIYEWCDFLINCGRYEAIKTAKINDADGITASDTAIVIDTVENPELWPATNGLVQVKAEGTNTDEYIRYANFTNNGNGTYTLSGCTRGQKGSVASTHADDAVVNRIVDYCVIPGGWCGRVTTGLNNTDDPVTFTLADVVLGPGGANPAVGDTLQCETELLIITGVNGTSITAGRGANGSTVAAHADGVGIVKISPALKNNTPETDPYQNGSFLTLRTEAELIDCALPATVSNATSNEGDWKDYFSIKPHGLRAALRGGGWDYGSRARSGLILNLDNVPSNVGINIGFRAALTL